MPITNIAITSAPQAAQNQDQKILFLGQMTSAGTAQPGILIEDLDNVGSFNTLFGANSHLANMIRAAKSINSITQMDVIPFNDADEAVAATSTLTFTGTATADGVLTINLGSSFYHQVSVAISSGNTATQAAAAAVAAINADAQAMVTASNLAGVVTITAVNAGTLGNEIGLQVIGAVAGISYTITIMSGGATDPVLTDAFDQIANIRYQTVVYPSTWDLSTIQAFMDPRFNAVNKILDGEVIIVRTDTYANLVTLGEGLNDKNINITANALVNPEIYPQYPAYFGPSKFEYNDVFAAEIAAIRGLRLTAGAPISNFVVAPSNLDSIGGPAIASLPYFNTPMQFIPISTAGTGFTDDEITGLLAAGISVVGDNPPLTQSIMGQMVTTYKTDAAGNDDVTFKFLEYLDTESNVREFYFNNLKSNYSQCRLTEGDLIPGRNMANAESIAAYCVGLFTTLSGEDYVLTQAGQQALSFYKNNLQVSLDLSIGLVTIYMVVPIVTQLRQINATMQIAFSTNG
jgi:phage tail sheath gpL-like